MPLSVAETKELLIQLFRLTLASSEKRTEDSVQAFTNILDVTLPSSNTVGKNEEPMNSMCNPSQIDLIISELNAPVECSPIKATDSSITDLYDKYSEEDNESDDDDLVSEPDTEASSSVEVVEVGVTEVDITEVGASVEFDKEVEVAEVGVTEVGVTEVGVTEVGVTEVDASVESDKEVEVAEAVSETDSSKDEEEEEALEVEPVRIRKIIYWKDINTGYIYTYLPDDEVGEKVGAYVGGKPEFD